MDLFTVVPGGKSSFKDPLTGFLGGQGIIIDNPAAPDKKIVEPVIPVKPNLAEQTVAQFDGLDA